MMNRDELADIFMARGRGEDVGDRVRDIVFQVGLDYRSPARVPTDTWMLLRRLYGWQSFV
jgi:hypothetical protein